VTTPDDLKAAALAGRAARPGAVNPFTGKGATARAWRAGYRRMLLAMIETSPLTQKETPQP
jgi:hypothetical protein